MAVLTDAFVEIASTDYSAQVRSVSLTYEAAEVEDTAMGDSTESSEGGLKSWTMEVTGYADETSGGMNADLFGSVGSTVSIKVRPTSSAVSATNPNYSGTALLSGEDNPHGGSTVGDSRQTTWSFTSAGDLSRATS